MDISILENTSDAISRQAAIDAIFSEPLYKSGMKKRDVDVVVPAIYEKIKALPPVQPKGTKLSTVCLLCKKPAVTFNTEDNIPYTNYSYCEDCLRKGLKLLKKQINALPPVQSDVPDTNVGDMISRQTATTIPVMPKEHRHYQTNNLDDAYEQGWTDLQECIENLPSAQPERTCVNCGRTANNGGWYADGRTRCPIEEHYALPKDGYCHLWEKRNFTDDDYPERRTDD